MKKISSEKGIFKTQRTKRKMLPSFLRVFLKHSNFARILSIIAALKLKKVVGKCRSIESYVDLAFSFRFGPISIRPAQIREEIAQLLLLLVKLRPVVVCEIGTAGGGTLFLFSRVSQRNATLISIDLPGGPFGGGYPKWKEPFYKRFAYVKQQIYLIRGNSHDLSTYEKVIKILANRKLDFLLIDGDHSYGGVRRDLEMYIQLVRKNGIIAFHDIVPGPPENVGGVPKLWNEIKHNFEYKEIVKDWNQNGYGIGAVFV